MEGDSSNPNGRVRASEPWIEKYRPARLDDIIAHKEIVGTIQRLIDSNQMPHLLLYGPPGTGKTSTILAIAKKLFGSSYRCDKRNHANVCCAQLSLNMLHQPLHRQQVLELNASDDRKLDVVREQIKNFASTRTIFSSQFKLVILDEADAMTQAAQMALRRVIEKFTTNTRFCLICNYVNRIIPALQSRCTRFRFQPLPEQVVRERLQEIAQLEGVTVLDAGIDGILHLSKGDMRKCLNIMQSASMFSATIDESAVYSTVGAPPPSVVSATVHVLLNQPLNEAVEHVRALMTTSGVAVQDLITELHGFVVRMKLPPKVMLYMLVSRSTVYSSTPYSSPSQSSFSES